MLQGTNIPTFQIFVSLLLRRFISRSLFSIRFRQEKENKFKMSDDGEKRNEGKNGARAQAHAHTHTDTEESKIMRFTKEAKRWRG
jgi:hypothetical protein